jgi:predicted Zn-dependent peptidase
MGKAESIHHYIWLHNDLSVINTDLDRYLAVTVQDIQRVAKQYLRSDNRTMVTAAPPKNS